MSISDLVRNINGKTRMTIPIRTENIEDSRAEERFAMFYRRTVQNSPPGFYESVNGIMREMLGNAPRTPGARAVMEGRIGPRGVLVMYTDYGSAKANSGDYPAELLQSRRLSYHIGGLKNIPGMADEGFIDMKRYIIACAKYKDLDIVTPNSTTRLIMV